MKNTGIVNLDDMKVYQQFDREGMLGHLHAFPNECEKAYEKAIKFSLPSDISKVDKVVILGMGGSAIGGDLVSSLASVESSITVQVFRGYNLPAYVNGQTLVVSSSYSGNTEETLNCFDQSIKAGARNLVITTGGKLRKRAGNHNVPVFSYDYKSPPRAALPYSFIPLLVFMRKLGFLKESESDINGMLTLLKEQSRTLEEGVPESNNPAKLLARKLYERLPIIYGAEIVAEVAHRWKTQINENSKTWSFYEIFPELNHNAVVGYEFPPEISKKVFVVMLRSVSLSPRVQLRYEITKNLLERAGVECQLVDGQGHSQIAEMMSLIYLGDFVSFYLAILNKTESTPVSTIDYLKSELEKHN